MYYTLITICFLVCKMYYHIISELPIQRVSLSQFKSFISVLSPFSSSVDFTIVRLRKSCSFTIIKSHTRPDSVNYLSTETSPRSRMWR